MWKLKNDDSKAVITAREHINSCHRAFLIDLPHTAVSFFMHGGVEFVNDNYKVLKYDDKFPRFLASCPIYRFADRDICFLDGGRGAPQAADTLETLAELGVKNVISVGMCGVFSEKVDTGDIIVPDLAFVEEGTSLHYYSDIECSKPHSDLFRLALGNIPNSKSFHIVSTDAVYRQTFIKEDLWRKKGAVGIDMETSALFSVGKILNLNVVSILIASDKHPLNEGDEKWQWRMPPNLRKEFFAKCINFAFKI